eukprot:scaffold5316_cov105-Isochrysis_galbana.AAC.7
MKSVSGSVMTSLTSGLYEPPHDNPSETESMRPSGAVRARADKARDRLDRKCLEGSLNMTRGHTIKRRHTAV